MVKKILIYMSLILSILIVTGIGVYLFIKSNELSVDYDKEIKIKLNEEITNLDVIKKVENGKIITKKKDVDTAKVGERKIKVIVEDFFNRKIEYTSVIKVYDDEAPTIECKKELETEEGTEIDLLKDIIIKDNSNEVISPEIKGEYSFDKPGEYKLTVVAKDSSDNETKEEIVLKVKEKVKEKKEEVKNPTSGKEDLTSKGYKITKKNGVTYIDGHLIVNKTYSLPSTYGSSLTSETTTNFEKMKLAAKETGINLYISSGFRSYSKQKTIYNNYVKKDGQKEADTYSARAGHSEHQSGLAIDLNIIDDSFADTKEAKWLAENCYKYGFIIRYPKGKSNETGYKYEPWHIRYVGKDLAEKLYNGGNWITMESYFGITSTYK